MTRSGSPGVDILTVPLGYVVTVVVDVVVTFPFSSVVFVILYGTSVYVILTVVVVFVRLSVVVGVVFVILL